MNAGPTILAVTFDVGGTLIHPWPSVGHVYADAAAGNGWRNLSPEILNENFAAAWRARRNFQHTRKNWADLVDRTFAGLCEPLPSRSFFTAIYQRFAQADTWRIFEDVLPALDRLASLEIPLAIISNWDERLRPLLRELRLEGYFETVVISCEVGFIKPSPVIFGHAARRIGVAPEHVLHVGDSPAEDIAGAQTAGFQAVLVERQESSSSAVLSQQRRSRAHENCQQTANASPSPPVPLSHQMGESSGARAPRERAKGRGEGGRPFKSASGAKSIMSLRALETLISKR